jgi:large subunit ribosomal protein L18
MKQTLLKNKQQQRRRQHVRRKIRAYAGRPRLSVTRSSKHISAQVIDDETGRTLAAASSTNANLANTGEKSERAAEIGREIARLAKEAGVEQVVFDRGHYKFHGRVKALADAAREAGLSF